MVGYNGELKVKGIQNFSNIPTNTGREIFPLKCFIYSLTFFEVLFICSYPDMDRLVPQQKRTQRVLVNN